MGSEMCIRDRYGVEVVGRLPLDLAIREQTDSGTPLVASDPSHNAAIAYKNLAVKVNEKLGKNKESNPVGPTITIDND